MGAADDDDDAAGEAAWSDQARPAPRPVRPQLIERPTYLYGPDVPKITLPSLEALCKRGAPVAGLLGATVVGVTAAYFAPKFFDWALARFGPDGDGDDVEFWVEDEPPR